LEEPKATPGVTVRGMLKDAAPFAHRSKRGGKAAGIIAEFVLVRLPRRPVPVPAPAFAGRMRHDRVRPAVQPGIARLVPRVHVRQSEVATPRLDEERRDHALSPAKMTGTPTELRSSSTG